MLSFEYTAKDQAGKNVKGIVEADTEAAAAKLLDEQQLSPTNIKLMSQGKGLKIFNRVKTKDRIIFTRQLATMINAGLPLTQSLRTVTEQTNSKELTLVVNKIIGVVEGGVPFSEALAQHPKVFNEVYIALVAAGETSGTLDEALERIATQQEKDADMISKVRGALVYPAIVTAVIVLVVVFLLTTVVPQIEIIYKDFDKELPFLTAMMISSAKFIMSFWWAIIIVAVGAVFFLSRWAQTTGGEQVVDKVKMKIPLFGDLFMKLYMARFCRTGQTLMASGVPMLEMLRITSRAVDNVHVGAAVDRSSEKVKGGKALSLALKAETEAFLPLVPQMLKIGEQSGSIDAMMDKAAGYYENELDNKIKAISTTIEPILMIFLAVVVGGIVMAILVPVYSLASENIGG